MYIKMDTLTCSICGEMERTENMAMLNLDFKHNGTSESGWGCVVCKLPAEGAVAIICADCWDDGFEDGDLDTEIEKIKHILNLESGT